jgi:hypothetical protein
MGSWEATTYPSEPGDLGPRTTYFHIHEDRTRHATGWLSTEDINPVGNVKCLDCGGVMNKDSEISSPCQPARR